MFAGSIAILLYPGRRAGPIWVLHCDASSLSSFPYVTFPVPPYPSSCQPSCSALRGYVSLAIRACAMVFLASRVFTNQKIETAIGMRTAIRDFGSCFLLVVPALAQNQMQAGPPATAYGPTYDVSCGYSYLSSTIPSAGRVDLNGLDVTAAR